MGSLTVERWNVALKWLKVIIFFCFLLGLRPVIFVVAREIILFSKSPCFTNSHNRRGLILKWLWKRSQSKRWLICLYNDKDKIHNGKKKKTVSIKYTSLLTVIQHCIILLGNPWDDHYYYYIITSSFLVHLITFLFPVS